MGEYQMKLSLILASLSFSFSAQAAEVLVEYAYNAGFSPRPGSEMVQILSDGQVLFSSSYRNRKTGKTEDTNYVLANLNQERVDALKAALPSIKAKDLVDQQEGKPMCTDAPSSEIRVAWGRKSVVFARRASCHTWINPQQPAAQVRQLVEGLVALSRI